MRDKFDDQLRRLHKEMLIMAEMVQDTIRKAMLAFANQDVDTAKTIMAGDDEINQEQKKIETMCFQLLIQQQPVARDLRVITAAMKMATDMERIGDQAADIAELTIMMSDRPYQMDMERIKKMATETILMLIQAIDAYVEKDMEKAAKVIKHDDVIDQMFLTVKSEVIQFMKEHPESEEQAADFLLVNKYLERIGDHATNIAEWVIFCLDSAPQEN